MKHMCPGLPVGLGRDTSKCSNKCFQKIGTSQGLRGCKGWGWGADPALAVLPGKASWEGGFE